MQHSGGQRAAGGGAAGPGALDGGLRGPRGALAVGEADTGAVGLGGLGEQVRREEDDRGGASVGAVLEDDLDAVAMGEAADDEQAQPVGVGEFELGGLGEPEVGVEQRFRVHAEAAVVDLQGEAVGDAFAVDLDGGVRRGEHGGVLQEFGDEVGDVGDGRALDAQAREAAYLDALVVLHLGDGGADDVHQLDGLAPLAGGRGAGEDHQALGVAAHARGHVVEAEQVGEFLGVLGAPFHGVEEGQLAVQEHLIAAGQVDEDLGDSAAQFGLLDGGLDGGALEAVEGEGDLADLVLLEFQAGRLGLDVDALACGEAAHDAGQPDAGGLVGVLAEPGQVADQVAADADGEDDGDDEGDEAEDAGDGGLDQDVHGGGLYALLVGVTGGGAHGGEVVEGLGGGLVPLGRGDGARGLGDARADEPFLRVAQGRGLGAHPVRLEAVAVLARQDRQVELVQQAAVGGEVGDVPDVGGADVAGDEGRGDDGVLAGERLAGAGDADEGAALLVQLHVLQGVEIEEELVAGVDEPAVELQGPGWGRGCSGRWSGAARRCRGRLRGWSPAAGWCPR
ncbi:hypothetical protein GCM10020254_68950 [Streptomyces goshikiensis]